MTLHQVKSDNLLTDPIVVTERKGKSKVRGSLVSLLCIIAGHVCGFMKHMV